MACGKSDKSSLKYLGFMAIAVFITDIVLLCCMALSFSDVSSFRRLLATNYMETGRDGVVSLRCENVSTSETDFLEYRERVDENANQAISRFKASTLSYGGQVYPVTAMESYPYPHSEEAGYNNLHLYFVNAASDLSCDTDAYLSQEMIYTLAAAAGKGFYDILGTEMEMGGKAFCIRGFFSVEQYLSRRTLGDYYQGLYGSIAFVSSAFFLDKTVDIEYSIFNMTDFDTRSSELTSFATTHGATKIHFASNSKINSGLAESMDRNRSFYESKKRFFFLIPAAVSVTGAIALGLWLKRPLYLEKKACYLGLLGFFALQLGFCFVARKFTPSVGGILIFVKSTPSILSLFVFFVAFAICLLVEMRRNKAHLLDPLSDSYIIK